MIPHISVSLRLMLAAVLCLGSATASRADTNHHVILITIDGLASYYLDDPKASLPNLRRLAAEGASASGLRVVNPAVTWPNHTTLVTGVYPSRHSVLFNGVLVRGAADWPVKVDPQRSKADLVAFPTIYDRLHGMGYSTAAINWPCTRGATTLDDDFPDVPEQIVFTTPRLRNELFAAGILTSTNQADFLLQGPPTKDRIWTSAAAHVIQKRRPNFMAIHMLITDSTQHKYGPHSPAAYTALALADTQLGDVLKAIDTAGIRGTTTLFVTADHGFAGALKAVNPNVAFRKAGLARVAASPTLIGAKAQSISEGGIAMVYLTDPKTRKEDEAKVVSLMREAEGVADILTPDKFPALHLPDPDKNPQMANLILVAKEGYAFGNDALGDNLITEVTLTAGSPGHHGVLSTNKKMNAAFVAWGRGIRKGAKLGEVTNVDVAPTMAKLLGQSLPDVDGKVIEGLLTDEAAR